MLSHLCFHSSAVTLKKEGVVHILDVFMSVFLWNRIIPCKQDENRKSEPHSKSIIIYYSNTNPDICLLLQFN